jgi:hypothetical protein
MTLVERHSHRPHYPSMPYKYTPVSARLGHSPLRIRSRLSSPHLRLALALVALALALFSLPPHLC